MDIENQSVETLEQNLAKKEQEAFARDLLSQIKEREQFFEGDKGWWKAGEKAVELYEGSKPNEVPYNILYSNTEVLLPSLFSATPKPDVRPRHKSAQLGPIPEMIDRFLTAATDPGAPGIEDFFSAVNDAVLSGLTAGAGFVRLRYYEERTFPLAFESVYYKNLIWPRGKKWSKLPWVAFKHEMTRETFEKTFKKAPEEMASSYKPPEVGEPDDTEKRSADCCVYEVWYKPTREVLFLSDGWQEIVVEVKPDPMQLVGFFPLPGLLQFTQKPGTLVPTPLFQYYQNQAAELNRVTTRLNRIISAIRVRGTYNSLLGDELRNLLSTEDIENGLIAAENSAAMVQLGGFDKNIWLLPIENLIAVAKELYKAREAIKQVIYELTGISDIIRGSSVASETATAQNIKNQWGTVRLRKMQTIVANYTRDLFRLAVDCGSRIIPAEVWQSVTQLPIPTEQEKLVLTQQVQYLQMSGQQVPPQLLVKLQTPTFEQILAQISDDTKRAFTVNIQNASTIDLDTASDKQEVTEYMNAMGQLMSGLQPLMQMGPSGFLAAKELLMGVSDRFKFGQRISEALRQIQPPQPAAPNPAEQAQAQAELEKIQLERELTKERGLLEKEKIAAEREKLRIDVAKAQAQLAAQQQRVGAQNATLRS